MNIKLTDPSVIHGSRCDVSFRGAVAQNVVLYYQSLAKVSIVHILIVVQRICKQMRAEIS